MEIKVLEENIHEVIKECLGYDVTDYEKNLFDLNIPKENFLYIFDVIDKKYCLPIYTVLETYDWKIFSIKGIANALKNVSGKQYA